MRLQKESIVQVTIPLWGLFFGRWVILYLIEVADKTLSLNWNY